MGGRGRGEKQMVTEQTKLLLSEKKRSLYIALDTIFFNLLFETISFLGLKIIL